MSDDLKDIRVIACTYTASGVDRLTSSWFPQILIGDEAARLENYELLMPLSTHLDCLTRLVLVGDHVQLGLWTSGDKVQGSWVESTFEKMIEGGWPQQMLNTNNWMHPDLCNPTSLVFYRNSITAARTSVRPGLLLPEHRTSLQINDNEGVSAKISSIGHFFDIRSKQEHSIQPEVCAVDIIVRALLSTGVYEPHQMMVIHGSREYRVLLSSKAKSNGWPRVGIKTVALTQGFP